MQDEKLKQETSKMAGIGAREGPRAVEVPLLVAFGFSKGQREPRAGPESLS